jgi:hypothetical protein
MADSTIPNQNLPMLRHVIRDAPANPRTRLDSYHLVVVNLIPIPTHRLKARSLSNRVVCHSHLTGPVTMSFL